MKTALAIRHVAFEDLGSLAPLLRRRGYDIRIAEAAVDDLAALDPVAPDLLVLLGGPLGVYEEDAYPFIADEIRLTEKRLAAGRPTLGLCLGSQMMARALGARVFPGPGKEIGWSPLVLTDAGRNSSLAHLAPDRTEVLHWHGDTFDLPDGAVRLASTTAYANQAFSFGRSALALQFHPEVTAAGLERWYIGHACEISATPGISVPLLRAEANRCAATLEMQAELCFAAWLAQLGG